MLIPGRYSSFFRSIVPLFSHWFDHSLYFDLSLDSPRLARRPILTEPAPLTRLTSLSRPISINIPMFDCYSPTLEKLQFPSDLTIWR